MENTTLKVTENVYAQFQELTEVVNRLKVAIAVEHDYQEDRVRREKMDVVSHLSKKICTIIQESIDVAKKHSKEAADMFLAVSFAKLIDEMKAPEKFLDTVTLSG